MEELKLEEEKQEEKEDLRMVNTRNQDVNTRKREDRQC